MRRAVRASIVIASLLACSEPVTPSAVDPGAEPMTARPEAPLPESRLRFAVTPYAARAVMQREFAPLVAHLSEALSLPVQLVIPKSYADTTERVSRGEVEVALLSPLAYVLTAERTPGLRVIATPIAQGAPTYAGYILVREDSGLTALAELEGRSIAFVDRRSTSGFLYPYAFLLDQGIEPEEFFGKIEFAGDHAAVVEALRNERVDAGATFAAARGLLEVEGALPDLRILAKTGRIPYDAVVVLPTVSERTVARLRDALLALNTRTEAGRQILRSSGGINGFLAADDGHYDEVRRVLQRVGPYVAIPQALPAVAPRAPLDTESRAH